MAYSPPMRVNHNITPLKSLKQANKLAYIEANVFAHYL